MLTNKTFVLKWILLPVRILSTTWRTVQRQNFLRFFTANSAVDLPHRDSQISRCTNKSSSKWDTASGKRITNDEDLHIVHSSSKRPHWLCGNPILILNAYRAGPSSGVKQPQRKAGHSSSRSAKSNNEWRCTSCPLCEWIHGAQTAWNLFTNKPKQMWAVE